MHLFKFHNIALLVASFLLFNSLTRPCDSAVLTNSLNDNEEFFQTRYFLARAKRNYGIFLTALDDLRFVQQLPASNTFERRFEINRETEHDGRMMFEHLLSDDALKEGAGFEYGLSLETPLPEWYVQWRFDNFKMIHGYAYYNGEEEMKALDNYRANLNRVYANNRRYIAGFEANRQTVDYPWGAMSDEQFSRNYLGFNMTAELEQRQRNPPLQFDSDIYDNREAPVTKDWRDTPCNNVMKHQRLCGSCYIFAAVAAMEARGCIKMGMQKIEDISQQQYLDCPDRAKYNNLGCEHGSVSGIFAYVRDSGRSDPLETYPYVAKVQSCKLPPAKQRVRVEGYQDFWKYDENLLIKMVGLDGPVIVAICVDYSFNSFFGKKNVFYNRAACDNVKGLSHAVVVVGYTKEALIIKNSWGKDWGNGGYMLMARGYTAASYIGFAIYPIMG